MKKFILAVTIGLSLVSLAKADPSLGLSPGDNISPFPEAYALPHSNKTVLVKIEDCDEDMKICSGDAIDNTGTSIGRVSVDRANRSVIQQLK